MHAHCIELERDAEVPMRAQLGSWTAEGAERRKKGAMRSPAPVEPHADSPAESRELPRKSRPSFAVCARR